jgi:hypothetical protein
MPLQRIVLWALIPACAMGLANAGDPPRAGHQGKPVAPIEGGPTVVPTAPETKASGPEAAGERSDPERRDVERRAVADEDRRQAPRDPAAGTTRANEPAKTPAPTEGGPTVAPTSPEVGEPDGDAPRRGAAPPKPAGRTGA